MNYKDNKILCQCLPDADILFDNFRNDISCQTLAKFKEHGVSLKDLLKFQQQVPAYYPWTEGYNDLDYNVNRRFVVFPMVIVMCTEVRHVIATIKFAQRYNLPCTTRSGAHCFESFSLITGVVIDQSRRKGFCINGDTITVESGCLQGPLQYALAQYGRCFVGGTCPNVGMGLILGSGIGFLSRLYGLTCDNLLSFDIVLADAKVYTITPGHDLFFAIQGAGNYNYGIATSFTLRTAKVTNVAIFDLTFKLKDIYKVLKVWQKWAPYTVEELTSELDVYYDHILITGQFVGDAKALKKLLKPILKLDYTSKSIQEVPFLDAARKFAGRPWEPFFKNHSGFVYKPLAKRAAKIIYHWMKRAGVSDRLELNALGGAVSKVPSNATAFPHREAIAWCHIQCHWDVQEEGPVKLKWSNGFYNELKPFLKGAYINCPDLTLEKPLVEYYGSNLPRLIEIKREYDPTNFFNYEQSIPV